jgi:hypothetical protein
MRALIQKQKMILVLSSVLPSWIVVTDAADTIYMTNNNQLFPLSRDAANSV